MAYAGTSIVGVTSARKRTHRCPTCKGQHSDPVYKMCSVCRDLKAAYHRVWRDDHRQRGLCTECVEKKRKGEYVAGANYTRCQHHIDYFRDWREANFAYKTSRGLCAYGACKVKVRGRRLCDEHNERVNAYQRKKKQNGRALPFRRAA